jgi:hypothetical protein
MKSFVRNALFGAAGLVVLSLPAQALTSKAVEDAPQLNSASSPVQMAQRNENPGGAGFRNENPGGAGFKKAVKHKKPKKHKKHKKSVKAAPKT